MMRAKCSQSCISRRLLHDAFAAAVTEMAQKVVNVAHKCRTTAFQTQVTMWWMHVSLGEGEMPVGLNSREATLISK
jgi:hypothetical protein